MILRRLIFPILLLALLLQSCQQGRTLDATAADYTNCSAKAQEYYTKQQFDSAFYFFDKAKTAALYNDEKVYSLYYMADIQMHFCDFSGAEMTLTEAYENCESPEYLPSIYTMYGILYEEQFNFKEARHYYQKCYGLKINSLSRSTITNNISVVYLDEGHYAQAAAILCPLVSNDSLIAAPIIHAKVLDNLGYAYFKLHKPEGFSLLQKALQIRIGLQLDSELIASYLHLADFYKDVDVSKGLFYARKAYQSAEKVNSPDDKIEALHYCIATAPVQEVKRLALRQIALSDSINRVRQTAKNEFAKIRYDSRMANTKMLRYKKQKEQILFWSLLLLFLGILGFLLFRYRSRLQLKQTVYKTETRIAKQLHDELANDVYQAMTYAETQDLEATDKKEHLLEHLDHIYTRTRNISQQNSEIPTDGLYKDALLDLINSFSSEKVNVMVTNSQDIEWSTLRNTTKIALYRVLQELLVNMKKHSQSSVVVLRFAITMTHLEVNYADNGLGTTSALISKKGLQNVENRITDIKGTITFDSETGKGFKVSIRLPK